MGSLFRRKQKPGQAPPASASGGDSTDRALSRIAEILEEVKAKSPAELQAELEATRERAASKPLRAYLLEYLKRGEPAGHVVMATANNLGLQVSNTQLCFTLTGLQIWARCYNWRYLHPQVSDREIADEVEAALAEVPLGGEGPGPALSKLAAQVQQQGHQVADVSILAGTGREVRQPHAEHAQLTALLNHAVLELDQVMAQACPGPRVSLTTTSPVRGSALYWAFVRMYDLDPRTGGPAVELAARQYFEELGEALHGAALAMDLDRGRYQG